MVATLGTDMIGIRDRALLLLGSAGASRRSELVAVDVDAADAARAGHIEIGRAGITVRLMRSKTDQEGQGQAFGIPFGAKPATCPVRVVQAWIKAAGIQSGPLFRSVNRHGQVSADRLSDKGVALVVKRCAEAAGLDPAKFAGHSLRAGLATSAAMAGVEERVIMSQTRHRSTTMVRRYIREGSLFRENAAGKVGL